MSLLDFARNHSAILLSPVPESEILGFETRTHYRLPKQLREFYLDCGGTEEFTDTIWKIWPFKELTPLPELLRPNPDLTGVSEISDASMFDDYLAFADALIHLPVYAVCANPHNPAYGATICLLGDGEQFLYSTSPNFDRFVQLLESEWDGGLLSE